MVETHHGNLKRNSISWMSFIVLTIGFILLTHAIAFFMHEYAHAFTAYLLGWKANPLALNYGSLSVTNILAQLEIDENVDYTPIFAAGQRVQAALIAVAGVLLGNVFISYILSRFGAKWATKNNKPMWGWFFYWLCVMSVGNFLCYVPIRVFSPREDMHTTAIGLQVSPWWIAVILGVPFMIALIHFFVRFEGKTLQFIFHDSKGQQLVTIVLTALVVFNFFGLAGWSKSGEPAHIMSAICFYGLGPVMALTGLFFFRNANSNSVESSS